MALLAINFNLASAHKPVCEELAQIVGSDSVVARKVCTAAKPAFGLEPM